MTAQPAEVAWRLRVAERIAAQYETTRLAAVTVGGSVGAGLADRWSDLEIDCFWHDPPSDADRRAPIVRLGADLDALWAYDVDEREWSEDYRIGRLAVTVSNFTAPTIDEWIAAVVEHADPDPVKHMRLAAIQRGHVLLGHDRVAGWQTSAARYPDRLVAAMVEQALTPGTLRGWSARDALVERGDRIALHALLSGIEQAVLDVLLAVNRVYRPHRVAKWQRHLIGGLAIAPDDLPARLDRLWQGTDALREAEGLLRDTVELVDRHTGADVSDFVEAMAERRRPADPR